MKVISIKRTKAWRNYREILRQSANGDAVQRIAATVKTNVEDVKSVLLTNCEWLHRRREYPHRDVDQERIIQRYLGGDTVAFIAQTTIWGDAHIRRMLSMRGVYRGKSMETAPPKRRESKVRGPSLHEQNMTDDHEVAMLRLWIEGRSLDEIAALMSASVWLVKKILRTNGFDILESAREQEAAE
jgi:hypothetical protein